jgi:hypothetical protein
MTRRQPIPTLAEITVALSEMEALADATDSRRPTALSLARHVGLANTTFRRNFPEITAALTTPRGDANSTSSGAKGNRCVQLTADNARLRRDNQQLHEHLDVACAQIQHLALEAARLQTELEAAHCIPRISSKRHH